MIRTISFEKSPSRRTTGIYLDGSDDHDHLETGSPESTRWPLRKVSDTFSAPSAPVQLALALAYAILASLGRSLLGSLGRRSLDLRLLAVVLLLVPILTGLVAGAVLDGQAVANLESADMR